MSDLISRDALIEAHYDYCNKHHDETAVFYGWSMRLMKEAPSAQPEKVDTPTVDTPTCEDAVSREAVLNGAITHYSVSGANIAYRNAVPVEYIKELPSVEPQRKKGKWLLQDGYRCSFCNYKLQITGIPNTCPNCNAEMEGQAE